MEPGRLADCQPPFFYRAIAEMKHAEKLSGRLLFRETRPVVTSLKPVATVKLPVWHYRAPADGRHQQQTRAQRARRHQSAGRLTWSQSAMMNGCASPCGGG